MSSISTIKSFVQQECIVNSQHLSDWFFSEHLEVVHNYAQELLKLHPEANREVVELAVWLHDMQRVYNLDGEHALAGATKAQEILTQHDYQPSIIAQVYAAIKTHRANSPATMPITFEGKILATADAMAHLSSTFYLKVFLYKMNEGKFANVQEFKDWALKKINRDYHQKIFFADAKDLVTDRYQTLVNFFASP